MLYVRSELKPSEYVPKARFPEHIWCAIRDGKNRQLVIGVCYRSDNANIFVNGSNQELMDLLNEVRRQHMLLLGDFNYGGIDWGSATGPRTSKGDCQMFIDCLDDNFLTQHVTVPTRGVSTLDLVLSRDPDLVSDVRIMETLASGDHSMLMCTVHVEAGAVEPARRRYDYNKADFVGFRRELGGTDWDALLGGDTHDCWQQIKTRVLDLERKYVPVRQIKT